MKKLLALVLALVMTLGLATVGASAADFKDGSSIEYGEAVNVMNGIGVIQGDDNGNFNPTGTLTREQAAKIVAYMLLGKSGSDSLSASAAPFNDVAADRWSAGAISYCATEGIIAGNGDGTFNPEGKLTGHQFAKMLLVALGYDAKLEGFTGTADWAINVAKLAVSAGLEDDLSIVMNKEITRDQAAMMAFNTLKADMVDYENGVNVKTSDGTDVTVNAKRFKTTDYANHYDGRNVAAAADDYDTFCEVYFKDLKLNKDGTNDFGEPMNQWSYKNVVISELPKSSDKTLVGSVTYQDLYKAAGDAAMTHLNNLTIYVDGLRLGFVTSGAAGGVDAATIKAEAANKYWDKNNDEDIVWAIINGSANNAAVTANPGINPTGNGTITNVYVDRTDVAAGQDTYAVTISIKHVYVGKVTSVNDGSPRKVTISAKTLPSATINGVTLDSEFETEEFKKDDIVLYTVAINGSNEAKIQTMKLATLVSGVEVSKTSSEGTPIKPNKSVVTAGGKDYKLNINAKVESNSARDAIKEFTAGDKFDLYLDDNGLIVWAEKTEEELNLKNYLVLTRGAMAAGTASNPVADAVTLDGVKLTNINVTKLEGKSLTNWGTVVSVGTPAVNYTLELYKVYKFTTNGSNYELKLVSGSYTDTHPSDRTYTSGNATFFGNTVNADSKLFVYDMDDSGVKTYTGAKNFPDVVSAAQTNGTTPAGSTQKLLTIVADDTNGKNRTYTGMPAALVAFYNGAEDIAANLIKSGNVVASVLVHRSELVGTTRYANVSTSVAAEDIIYVTSKNWTTTKDGDDEVYTFDVIKDGKLTTVSTKNKAAVADVLANDQDLYVINSYDGDYIDTIASRRGAVAGISAAITGNGLMNVVGADTQWGRAAIVDDSNRNDQIGIKPQSNVYSVDIDVKAGTFKLTTKDVNGDDIATQAFTTNSSTKFFEISDKGAVSEISAEDFTYDGLTKGEFSVIYNAKDQVATYVFYQKV